MLANGILALLRAREHTKQISAFTKYTQDDLSETERQEVGGCYMNIKLTHLRNKVVCYDREIAWNFYNFIWLPRYETKSTFVDFAEICLFICKSFDFRFVWRNFQEIGPNIWKTLFEGCFLFCYFSIIAFENSQAQIWEQKWMFCML